ncbi:MAG: DUF3568 family protein [Opitutaceae bacterium]
MKRRLLGVALGCLLASFTIYSTGCVAVAVAYATADLEVPLDATATEADAAIMAGCKDANLIYIWGQYDEQTTTGSYHFRTVYDNKVAITFERMSDVYIMMRIRVDNFGDEYFSERLARLIKKRLEK